MADNFIDVLARSVQSKLCYEASSDYQDLRRIVGHANVLDHLTAELNNLGCGRDADDVSLDEGVIAENELDISLKRYRLASQKPGVEEEGQRPQSSEDFEHTGSCDEGASDSADSAEGDDNNGGTHNKCAYTSAHSCQTAPLDAAIQVSVTEVDEFDEDMKFGPLVLRQKGIPLQTMSRVCVEA